MRTTRSALCTAALALAGALAMPAAPAGAGYVFHVKFNGKVALGSWTTCPVWTVGTICQDTYVIAASAATMEGRDRAFGPSVILRRYRYQIVDLGDEGLDSHLLTQSLGITYTATVAIDPRARRGYVHAPAIRLNTCVADAAGDLTCRPENTSFEGTWTGVGMLRRYDERFVMGSRYFVMRTYTLGWERSATAVATDTGRRVPGALVPDKTMLINARQGELRAYPGPRRD